MDTGSKPWHLSVAKAIENKPQSLAQLVSGPFCNESDFRIGIHQHKACVFYCNWIGNEANAKMLQNVKQYLFAKSEWTVLA